MKQLIATALFLMAAINMTAIGVKTHIIIKQPGNPAVTTQLRDNGGQLVPANGSKFPLAIASTQTALGDGLTRYTVTIKATELTYFNFGAEIATPFATDECDFYLPGFWYHKNLRSPKNAPSFHTSKSWNVREDRLSSPLTGVFNQAGGTGISVRRQLDKPEDALGTSDEGDVILNGPTSVGYLGFDNRANIARLTFGYPYIETPKRYMRKLTLKAPIRTFARIDKGESRTLTWVIRESKDNDFSGFVASTWQYCYDAYKPQMVNTDVDGEQVKRQLTGYFREAYVGKYDIKFNSGNGLRIDQCQPMPEMEIGFCGRALLNAFNELEWGEANGDTLLASRGRAIFDSFLHHGFTDHGNIYDHVFFEAEKKWDGIHSIRRQSEAVYATLHFLRYDKRQGVRHKDWEAKVRTLVDNLLKLQNADGSFPRKFRSDGSIADTSGGSTPSATSALVMAYKYFGDKRYLNAAAKTVDYVEKNIIDKSDYFSSTLDANCEDKEAAIAAVTATYYMTLVSKGRARQHYADLCHRAAYFALSWYYLWDVPFAQGQMLGDLGFHSRGFSNVSVENNHVDVFVFEFGHILSWLGKETDDNRFTAMYQLMRSSLSQLMPTPQQLCGIGKPGFYPEVLQHTNWDYGHGGKGFYNTWFAPGWTVASLWELYSPNRTTDFFGK